MLDEFIRTNCPVIYIDAFVPGPHLSKYYLIIRYFPFLQPFNHNWCCIFVYKTDISFIGIHIARRIQNNPSTTIVILAHLTNYIWIGYKFRIALIFSFNGTDRSIHIKYE